MEQEEKRKQEATYPPFDFMRTQNRVLPLLPRWMRNKLVEAKNLHDHVNVICEGRTFWNHTITLPLDKWHDVTFAILDNYNSRREFRKTIQKVVEVYEDLQVLYRKYGHSLTIVSLQTEDFGMLLPSSFYKGDTTIDKGGASYDGLRDALKENKASDFMAELMIPIYSRMEYVVNSVKRYASTLDDDKKKRVIDEYNAKVKKKHDYFDEIVKVLRPSKYDYFLDLKWDCYDIYMEEDPIYGRELCVKWKLGENIKHLKKLDTLRPLFDAIVEKTKDEEFAFGVKRRGAAVVPCDLVSYRSGNLCA